LLFSREQHIKRLKLVAKSPFWTAERPAENSKQLLCGFFYEALKSLLPGPTKSWQKWGNEAGFKGLIFLLTTNQEKERGFKNE
jgi:hypothetical protein